MEILGNNSQYAFKITQREDNSATPNICETIHIIKDGKSSIFEAVYDSETGDFSHAYNKYTREEYFSKQEELLEGYEHYANIDWTELLAQSLE